MNDKYLFRGVCIWSKKWVYGAYITNYKLEFDDKEIPVIHRLNGMNYKVNEYIPIIPETVGQWTGLVDKNGVNIFDGDILKNIDSRKSRFAIDFDFGNMGAPLSFCADYNRFGEQPGSSFLGLHITNQDLIGSIHDHLLG